LPTAGRPRKLLSLTATLRLAAFPSLRYARCYAATASNPPKTALTPVKRQRGTPSVNQRFTEGPRRASGPSNPRVAGSIPARRTKKSVTERFSSANTKMSLADAGLVRMSETLAGLIILTTDADFRIYRRYGR